MPTIKTREFKHTSLSGEVMQFRAPITVDTHGEFTVNIPEELAESARALAARGEWKGQVRLDHARINWRVQARLLDKLESFVEAAIREHLAVEITRELVILYRHENMTAFSRAADGSMHPNGIFSGDGGTWAGSRAIHATTAPPMFSVGVNASVQQKITYIRPSGSRVVYENPPGSHFERNAINRLNGFCVQSLVERRFRDSDGERLKSGAHEMPYTEQAANFFADMMLAMCRLGEQLDAFVGNRETLLLAIERGTMLLPGPTATNTQE